LLRKCLHHFFSNENKTQNCYVQKNSLLCRNKSQEYKMDKIRYALIGFGGIAENRIAKEGFALDKERFQLLNEAVLTGVTDVNPERKNTAEALGLTWYNSASEIFDSPDIDAVYIATNNLSHFTIAKDALQAGKHVILEKPVATKAKHAEELVRLAKEKNLSLSVDHMMVYNAYNIKAQELISSNVLGEVNDIVLHMEFFYGSTPEEAATWRCSKPEELGGPIGDVASHCLYMAEFLLSDEIESVQATYNPKILKIEAEDGAFIQFKTKEGKTGSIRVSFNAPRGNLHSTLLNLGYEVYGSQKSITACGTLFQFSGHAGEPIVMKVKLHTENEVEEIKPGQIKNIYQQVIEVHAKSILDNKFLSGKDSLHNLKLILAIHESAGKSGKEVLI
jgi:predicted dehydrogenase